MEGKIKAFATEARSVNGPELGLIGCSYNALARNIMMRNEPQPRPPSPDSDPPHKPPTGGR